MADPWKDAWEHLKKFLNDRIENRERACRPNADFKWVREWISDKEAEMVDDGLIEGSEAE